MATRTALDDVKADCRKAAAKCRDKAAREMPEAALQLAGHAGLVKQHFNLNVIAGYWPIKTELDCRPLMAALSEHKQSVMTGNINLALPVITAAHAPLRFHLWEQTDILEKGPYQTCQPCADRPEVDPDLILVPLLAFDKTYHRLGYGGGFYDRTLASLAEKGHRFSAIGVAYDTQYLQEIPIGPFDRALDGIITPSGLYLKDQGDKGWDTEN